MVTRFGAYEILYELKTGGMGAVLLGRRRGPGAFEQLVALKTILSEHARTEAVRAMFLDEAALLARLAHPAIASVHDFGEVGGTLYMAMEYVAGIAFRELGALAVPPSIAARAVAEACRGVHAAHELRDLAGNLLGVVHRDISPDNLMLGYDGHVKVIDFGIALVKNRQAPVTEFGTLKGKPPYMSPEQIKNEVIDRRSDVFSLAVVLWELLTGQSLFTGDSIYAVARAVEHLEIRPPSLVLGAPLPLGLDAAVMNALDRDVARRTPTAAAFAEQLEAVIQGAGDETIEAWAARVLASPRDQHRAWLAQVVAGQDAPRAIGRPTGMVTALAAPAGKAATMLAPASPAALPVNEPPAGPQVSTHLAAADPDEGAPARRSVALPLLLGVAVLAVVIGALGLTRGSGASGEDAAVIRASIDAAPAPIDAAPAPIDAAPAPDDLVEDAGPREVDPPAPADASPSRPPTHRRPPRAPLDAGPRRAVDAAHPEPAADTTPRGNGKLIAKHKGDRYLSVVLDGRLIGQTPMFGEPIASGVHVIELVEPRSSEVVVRRTVRVEVGEAISVVEP